MNWKQGVRSRFCGGGTTNREVPLRQHAFSGRTIALALAAILLLSACGSGGEEPTPTLSSDEVQTQAVATYAGFLTATALSMPTDPPTATETPTMMVTGTPAATNTPSSFPTAAGNTPASSCLGLRFVSDVTIPDDTEMAPGEEFTKTWRVRNSGTCAWEEGFRFDFIGGDRMDGSAVTLEDEVQAGEEEDLSVELTAPDDEGTYRGNWRMRNASGSIFGDEVFVQIIVGDATATAKPTTTATAQASATPSPTATTAASETPTEAEAPYGS